MYHAIEANTVFGKTLSLLYVSPNEEDWEMQRLYGNNIASYTVNLSDPDLSEFGDIAVDDCITMDALPAWLDAHGFPPLTAASPANP